MSKNVVSLRGEIIVAPYEPVEDTITRLEEILERARNGEVKGFHCVLVHGDDSISIERTLLANHRTIGAVHSLAYEMTTEFTE